MTERRRWDLRRAAKSIDAWWTVLVIDPVAIRMLPLLLRIEWVTPNLVTAVAFVVGAGAVTLFALGHLVAGALLYELRFFIDCLDGKIARVRAISSTAGAALDRTADSLSVPAAYAALGLVLAHRHGVSPSWALLPALMSCLVSVLELSLELLLKQLPPAAPPMDTAGSGPRGFLTRHRLRLLPWTVEAETVGLFLAPLTLTGHRLGVVELVVAAGYGVFIVIDLAEMARAVLRTV